MESFTERGRQLEAAALLSNLRRQVVAAHQRHDLSAHTSNELAQVITELREHVEAILARIGIED